MASIGTTYPTGSTYNSDSSSSTTTGASSLSNEQAFLTLLVAQLKNQDPMQPQDGTQFVTQLAQFTNLEQSLAMRSDLDALKTKYAPDSPSTSIASQS